MEIEINYGTRMKNILLLFSVLIASPSMGQRGIRVINETNHLYTVDYIQTRQELINSLPKEGGKFGTSIKGIYSSFNTDKKEIALTLDACGGGYNKELIDILRKEKIPASLFVSGLWIVKNKERMKELSIDSLFEIENHGLLHRVTSVNGRTAYKLPSTRNMEQLIDEMELNAMFIKEHTGKRPQFFRSASAYVDEGAIRVAEALNMKIVNFSIISGDGVPGAEASVLRNNIVRHIQPGAVIVMHFNHPEWNEAEAMRQLIPLLRAKGYRFVKLSSQKIK